MADAARVTRGARLGMGVAAPVLVDVFGDVEEMREEAERPHHVQRLVDRQRVEAATRARTCPTRRGGSAPRSMHRFDAAARVLADLLADHLAQEAPEEPPVLAQRELLVHDVHEPL